MQSVLSIICIIDIISIYDGFKAEEDDNFHESVTDLHIMITFLMVCLLVNKPLSSSNHTFNWKSLMQQ